MHYKKVNGELKAMISVHVDDFLVAGEPEHIESIRKVFFEKFAMKRNELKQYLWMNIKRVGDRIEIDM